MIKKDGELTEKQEFNQSNQIYPTIQKPLIQPTQPEIQPSQPLQQVNQVKSTGLDSYVPAGLDPEVVLLQKAIRQHESGNRAQLPGEGAEVGGASLYQYTHGTWKSVAKKYLGDENAPLNRENENKATYYRILDWKKQGYNVGQIASMWNAGEGRPNAYKENWKGVNEWGVRYDTPAYARKVYDTYKQLKSEYKPTTKTNEQQYIEQAQKGDPLKTVDELKSQYEQIKNYRNQLLVETSAYADKNKVQELFDSGKTGELQAYLKESLANYSRENRKSRSWFLRFGDKINKIYEAYTQLPVVKQAGQAVGSVVGGLGMIETALTHAIGQPIANLAKGEKFSKDWWESIKEGAKRGYEFGREVGQQGTYAAPVGALGKIPLTALDIGQVISGGEMLGESLETGDTEKAIQAGAALATPIIAPVMAGVRTKGFTKMRGETLVDAMFGRGKWLDPSVKEGISSIKKSTVEGLKEVPGVGKIVENIELKKAENAYNKGIETYNKLLNITPTERANLTKKYGSTDAISKTLIEESIPLKIDETGRYETIEQAKELRERMSEPAKILNEILSENPLKRNDIEALRERMKEEIASKRKSALEVEDSMKEIDDIFDAEMRRYGKLVNDTELNQIKQGLWSMSYNQNRPNMNQTAREIGHIIKDIIEKNNPDVKVKELNSYIGRLADTAQTIEKMNGKIVPAGGVFSKRIMQTIGAISGSSFPVLGNIAGFQVAGKVFEYMRNPERLTMKRLNEFKKIGVIPENIKNLNEAKAYLVDLKVNPKKTLMLPEPTAIYGKEWQGGQSGIIRKQQEVDLQASQKAAGVYKKPLQLQATKGTKENPIILPEAKKQQIVENIKAKKTFKEKVKEAIKNKPGFIKLDAEILPKDNWKKITPDGEKSLDLKTIKIGDEVKNPKNAKNTFGEIVKDTNEYVVVDKYENELTLIKKDKLQDLYGEMMEEKGNIGNWNYPSNKKMIEKVESSDIVGGKFGDATEPFEMPISKKEQIKAKIEAKKIIDPKKPTTKILNELNGKTTVKRQFIDDLTRKPDISKVEKEIISEALKTEGDIINTKQFAQKVQNELLPLKIKNVLGDGGSGLNARYENISLPSELRGNVQNYAEHIYESPIKTSAGDIHWSRQSDKYFGHTRVEDLKGNTRRVIEVQSDLYQKGRLENEIDLKKMALQRIYKQSRPIEDINYWKNEVEKINKLQQYSDPTAHYRMVREEIKQAAIDGKKKLQFPTGETAMKIEGLGNLDDANTWVTTRQNKVFNVPEDLFLGREIEPEVGMEIQRTYGADTYSRADDEAWIITEVLGDGKFKAIQKGNFDGGFESLPKQVQKQILNNEKISNSSWKSVVDQLSEQFDISRKIDTKNPIYKFYEETMGKYLKNKYGAKTITDAQGVKWNEIDIDPKMKNEPTLAFGFGTAKSILSLGILAAGAGLLIPAVAKDNKVSNTNEPKEVNQTAQANLEPKKDINASIEEYIKTIKVEINGTGSNLGNTLAKDNNNPGNLIFAGQPNALKGDGGFAKFPTPELGFRALIKQVQADQRRNLSLRDFITKYAPPTENNTEKYIKDVSSELGIEESKNIAELDPIELAKKMAKFESNTTITE